MTDEKVDPAHTRPVIEFLSKPLLERILAEAVEVLAKVGVYVEHEEALHLLSDAGATIDASSHRAFIPDELLWRCVRRVRPRVDLFTRQGNQALRLEGLNVHFDPGSAALKILDSRTGMPRPAATADLAALSQLTDALPNIAAQSTGLVPSDVPEAIADRYRLYIALLNSTKPIVTGTFTTEGFSVMKEMLTAIAGDEESLKLAPRAIFDACASQPLKWSRLTTQSLLDCARSGIPAELISVPMLGATAPATLAGALVQHSAENLSGLVIHQVAQSGSPLIYGGSPAVFDMRHGTIALGASESMMLCCGYAQIGRYLGLPTHGYLGLSDAKTMDAQAGMESGIGAVMAALGGINVVSGAGMLEFENCQSLEKLALDDEACGMARRIVDGIRPREERLAEDLFGDLSQGDLFLTSPVTLRWSRREVLLPSRVIDREPAESCDRRSIVERARERVEALLAVHKQEPLDDSVRRALEEIMTSDARRHGLDRLPEIRSQNSGVRRQKQEARSQKTVVPD